MGGKGKWEQKWKVVIGYTVCTSTVLIGIQVHKCPGEIILSNLKYKATQEGSSRYHMQVIVQIMPSIANYLSFVLFSERHLTGVI